MEPITLLTLAAGLVLLFGGGELLVRGSVALARRFGVSALVIGVTVVAFGTSAPEAVVSGLAAIRGQDNIAVGNVVGSNAFNVLAILGACALLRPLAVSQQLVVRDVPVMIAVSIAFWLLAVDGRLGWTEGLLFLLGLVLFTLDAVGSSRRESREVADEYAEALPARPTRALASLLQIAAGLVLLVIGARWLVSAAIVVAKAVGVDDTVIALTIVAAGTSMPEVATSIVATLRGQRDIAVGNVIGSNIFNLLGILGVSAMLGGGLEIAPAFTSFDIPIMVAIAVACLPIVARRHEIARWQGVSFLLFYVAYVTYLVLAAKQHAALERFSVVMLEFVIPLSVASLIALVYAHRARGSAPR